MLSIRIRDAAYAVNGRTLFEGVSATLRAGECLGLLGPNGSGKTTFLDCLFGLRRFQEGRVDLETAEAVVAIDRWSPPQLVRSGFRRVFQKSPALPARPARELLCAVERPSFWRTAQTARLGGDDHSLRNELATVVSSFSGLSEQFSFGQARLSLTAFALASEGRVLLLDEPFEGLSATNSSLLARAMAEALDDGAILVVADHDRTSVEGVATRVLELGAHTDG